MSTILAISGSLRSKSYNTMLLRAAAASAPAGTTIDVGSIEGIPLYNGDVEATTGLPPTVVALKERIATTDGVLLVSPEYNHGIPGVVKNAIDWLSRPAADIPRVFGQCPFGVIGATPGRGATALAQAAWLPVLHTLGTNIFTGASVQVAGAAKVFDANGMLVDDTVRGVVAKYMSAFAQFVARHKRAK